MVALRVLAWKWCYDLGRYDLGRYDLGPKQNWGHGVSGVALRRFDPATVEPPQVRIDKAATERWIS
jgi:hypothetical protein